MKIDTIRISNFRGIKNAHASNLTGTIIVAGQNGSGKSCLFDAIRLLKSVYGGYQQNEWQHWLGEFQINVNARGEDLLKIFNDPTKPLSIECLFEVSDEEKSFIIHNSANLLSEAIWRLILPEAFQFGAFRAAMFSSHFRDRAPEVQRRVAEQMPLLNNELAQPHIIGAVSIQPGQQLSIRDSIVLSTIFGNYKPREIGLIDYHGAQRHYGRENVQSLNINLDQIEQNQSAHALYNYANKYANVKGELATAYVKEVLAERAGMPIASQATLTKTLQELFETFFPDKKFLGPVPTAQGNLTFPVLTPSGTQHDLDDLSSGEKEILYGYLRIRNSAPRFSVILLDEPELHLNPRLIRGLPQFYRKHLGEALDNQIWLVSHSDALLREAVGKPGFNVFHMQPAGLVAGETGVVSINVNQLKPLRIEKDLDALLTDLVGDLAAYQPGRKAIIFEGGGDSDFDQWMTSKLFPEIQAQANLISGSNKHKVRALHDVLARAHENGDISTKFFAITDGDWEGKEPAESVNLFVWDVYHIENYLLDEHLIADVLNSLRGNKTVSNDDVLSDLKRAARATVPKIARYKLTRYANECLVGSISLAFDPAADDVAGELSKASMRSALSLQKMASNGLSEENLRAKEQAINADIEMAFADGSWKKVLPGREVLKAFLSPLDLGIQFTMFRSLLVNRLADKDEKPEGMMKVVNAILAA